MTLAYLHVCAHICMCAHIHLQKLEDNLGSSLPPCGSWRSDSGHQAWLQFSYPPNHPACLRLALCKWDICVDSRFSSHANSQVRGPMPWDHYPCSSVKGKAESTARGEVLSLRDLHSKELWRSKLYSMNKEYYWGSAELPFRRVRPRWWFMWGEKRKRNQDGPGKMALNPSQCIYTHQGSEVTRWLLIFRCRFLKPFAYLLFVFCIWIYIAWSQAVPIFSPL